MTWDKQDARPVGRCDRCQAEQYREDYMYIWDGLRLCGECIEEKFDCLTIKEKADLMGAVCVKAGE